MSLRVRTRISEAKDRNKTMLTSEEDRINKDKIRNLDSLCRNEVSNSRASKVRKASKERKEMASVSNVRILVQILDRVLVKERVVSKVSKVKVSKVSKDKVSVSNVRILGLVKEMVRVKAKVVDQESLEW